MTNPIILTLSAILLTIFGEAPISAWEPLYKDIIRIVAEYILRLMEVLM